MQTETKPRYLGLLNAISLAETQAGIYLTAWANATTDEELACTLRFVAARETSHGELFCRRLAELGYGLRQKPDPEGAARLSRYADPKIGDLEKIGRARGEVERDPFGEIEQKLKEGFYDPMTANLLTWYICEERDSGRRLRETYACVRARAASPVMAPANDTPKLSAEAQAIVVCISEGFQRLEKKLDELVTRAG
jgi:hypothetical protein